MKNGSFYKVDPNGKFLFWIDHHLISTHNTCERLFDFRHNQHLRQKGMKAAMSIGSWWSRTMELLYSNVDEKGHIKLDKRRYMEDAAKAWRECYYCNHTEQHVPKVIEGGETYMQCGARGCVCTKFLNMESMKLANPVGYEKFHGIEGAIVMASDYWDAYAGPDSLNWRILSAEKGFGLSNEVVLGETESLVVYYVGKPDLYIFEEASDTLMPLDHKTIDRVVKGIHLRYKPHPQTAGYIWVGDHLAKTLGIQRKPTDRCIINIAGRSLPAEKPRDGQKKPRFTRVYPNYSQAELEEWRLSVIAKAGRLQRSLLLQEWLPRESACHLYAGCDFREVCNKPAGMVRELVLKTDYVQIAPWVPYEVDTDES